MTPAKKSKESSRKKPVSAHKRLVKVPKKAIRKQVNVSVVKNRINRPNDAVVENGPDLHDPALFGGSPKSDNKVIKSRRKNVGNKRPKRIRRDLQCLWFGTVDCTWPY